MKKIYVATNPIDAHLLKGILEGENITAMVQGEFLWGVRGEVPITPETCPSVWIVNDSDYERAVELLSTLNKEMDAPPQKGEDWRCNKCEEVNESQFTECWQCGTDRPL